MKITLIAFLLFITNTVWAQEKSFTVSGKISGLDSKTMNIYYKDAKGKTKRDSIPVLNESFSYTAPISRITMISINPGVKRVVKRTGRGYYPVKSSLLLFIAAPGAHIKFSGKITDFVDAYPSGDAANEDMAELNRTVFPLMNKSVNLMLKIANKEVTDSVAIIGIRKSIKKLDERVVSIKKEFVGNRPSSVTAAWLLSDMMIRSQVPGKEATKLFAAMSKEKLVAVPFYTEVAKRIDGINSTGVGKTVPEIKTRNTYDGKMFDLTSLRGKYVIVDFWGTWCGPCISGMPMMKEYLDKYKKKLAIVGIAQESDGGKSWRKFLDKRPAYQWHQILNKKDEDYVLKFAVAGFPTKIIIDPEGKVVERFVGEDDTIYKKIDEILSE